MKLALREEMTPGKTLAERLAFLERVGMEGIELTASLTLPEGELKAILADSPVRTANVAGSSALLDPDPAARREGMELTKARLALAGEPGAAGVPVFLEPLNRYEQHLVNRLEQGTAFAEEVGAGVSIMADFFHMNIEEADIAESIRAAGRHLVYVHVADSNRLQPGSGHLDFRPGFRALKEIGYDGWLGIECRITDPFEESLLASAALLRELWEAA